MTIETYDPEIKITRSLLEAACAQLRRAVAEFGCDDQVVLNLQAAIDRTKPCPYCNGTGERDSGGTYPWGAPAMIPCNCDADEELTSIEQQFMDLAEGIGAPDDKRDVLGALSSIGLRASVCQKIMLALIDSSRIEFLQRQIRRRGMTGVSFDYSPAIPAGWRYMHYHYLADRKPSLRGAIDIERGKETRIDGRFIYTNKKD